MFTGIVEEMGAVTAVTKGVAGRRITIMAAAVMSDLATGASISVNGACLTVVAMNEGDFSVDVSPETLAVTTAGQWAAGSPVNLERAMRIGERIGGHLVSGHVDAIGIIRGRRQDDNAIVLECEAPQEVLRFCVSKGSISVDGVSLTVNKVADRSFFVSIIPHTAKVTTLGLKQVGEAVNLESDLIGKYVERLLQERGIRPEKSAPVIDREYLQKRGLI